VSPGTELPIPPRSLAGSVLARNLVVNGERWSKGRRLSVEDLRALEAGDVSSRGPWAADPEAAERRFVTLLLPELGDVHEDDAARRLAAAVSGPGLSTRGPNESRIDLVAEAAGAVRVRHALLEQLNRIDGLSVFSVLDGQLVSAGGLVASVKTGPHLVPEASMLRAEELAVRTARGGPIVSVRPYRELRVAAVVKEVLAAPARARFEAALRDKVESLGSVVADVRYVPEDASAVEAALRALVRGKAAVDLVLTAGAASTDPADPVFVAFAAVGGTIRSHGVPAHPGSMLWLGRAGRTTFLGLPTCGAYSKATAADLLVPWLLTGEAPSRALVARLAHGGILTRDMRFRFPPYARSLDAPEG
jgi:hypothetical protein